MTKAQNDWWENFFNQQYITEFETEGAFARTDEYTEKIIDLLKLKKGDRILDSPCGFGRYSAAFQKKGFEVTGVDIVKTQIDEANKNYAGPTYIEGDMRDVPAGKKFDAVINLLTSFGYFLDQDEDIKPMIAWHESLKTGGKLIMELRPLESMIYHFKPILDEHGSENDTYTMDWVNSIMTVNFSADRQFRCKYYSVATLKYMLQKAGFSDIEIYGSFELEQYSPKSKWGIIIATKK